MRVGFQWVWETLLTWVCGILLPKFFVRTSTILYGRKCLRQTFSFLFSSSFGVVSDFIQNFIKRRRVLLKTQFKRETERQREERTLFHFAIISSFNKTCCRFIVVVRIIIRRPLLVFYEKKALLIKERRFDLYEKRHFWIFFSHHHPPSSLLYCCVCYCKVFSWSRRRSFKERV